MRQRLASVTLACAVLACWGGVWVAQSVKEVHNDIQFAVMPVADLSGVTRVVWDVAAPDQRGNANIDTLVLAGWTGELRLTTQSTRKRSRSLELVREGNTVYVRAGEATNRQRDTNQAPWVVQTPSSLTLPASVTELVWPGVRLVMSSQADMQALTIRSNALEVTTIPRGKSQQGQRSLDPLINADLNGDDIPGKLGHLTAIQMLHRGCAESDAQVTQRKSGLFEVEGGFFEKLTVMSQNGRVRLQGLQPNTRVNLYATAATSLDLSKLPYLEQLSVHKLSAEQATQLVPTLTPHQNTMCLTLQPGKPTGE